jgi:hypothetical protein
MKTQEEIEQLSFKNYGDTLLKGSFIHGYTKCQEDMADKKYTEDDMRNIFLYGHDKGDSSMVLMDKEKSFQDFINSLNKQD